LVGIGNFFENVEAARSQLGCDIVIFYWTLRTCLQQCTAVTPFLQDAILSKYVDLDFGSFRGDAK
jgi:hypothetical protein